MAGRGATALWAALEAIAARIGKRGEVIIPDLLCTSVLEAVLAAGFTPRFAEVSPETFSITPESIRPLLSQETCAVIVVHLFGYLAKLDEIASLIKGRDIYLIEDAVQAIGGLLPSGHPVGSAGDFSFVSFDSSKTINGRGAILFYDDETWTEPLLASLQNVATSAYSPAEVLLNSSWRDLYHALGQALRQNRMPSDVAASIFKQALPIYAPLLFLAFDDHQENLEVIQKGWDTLFQRVPQRNEWAVAFQDAVRDLPIQCPPVKQGDAIWRYSVLFQDREAADRFIVDFRRLGGLASHLYYPLHQLYQPELRLATVQLASRLVNLWVDEKVDQSYLNLVRSVAQAAVS